jgi:hypothetical protein
MSDPDTIVVPLIALLPGRKHNRVLRGLQLAAEDRPADEIDLFIRAGNQHQAGAGVADRRALDEDAGAGARRQDAGGINEIALDDEDAAAGCFHLARVDSGIRPGRDAERESVVRVDRAAASHR